jgi:hypothetical protein
LTPLRYSQLWSTKLRQDEGKPNLQADKLGQVIFLFKFNRQTDLLYASKLPTCKGTFVTKFGGYFYFGFDKTYISLSVFDPVRNPYPDPSKNK